MLSVGMFLSLLSLGCFAVDVLIALLLLLTTGPGLSQFHSSLATADTLLFVAGCFLLVAGIAVSLGAMRPGQSWQGGVLALLLAVASIIPICWVILDLPPFPFPAGALAMSAGMVFLFALDRLALHNGFAMRPGLISARPPALLLLLSAAIAFADFAGGLPWAIGELLEHPTPMPIYPYVLMGLAFLAVLALAGASLRSFRLLALATPTPPRDNDRTVPRPDDGDDIDFDPTRKAPPFDGRTDHLRRGDD